VNQIVSPGRLERKRDPLREDTANPVGRRFRKRSFALANPRPCREARSFRNGLEKKFALHNPIEATKPPAMPWVGSSLHDRSSSVYSSVTRWNSQRRDFHSHHAVARLMPAKSP